MIEGGVCVLGEAFLRPLAPREQSSQALNRGLSLIEARNVVLMSV
jgi:hypothetical protein